MTSRYEFADYSSPHPTRKQHRRKKSHESLTYSSSSQAGESTDSEFDDDNRRNHQNQEVSGYASDSLKYSEDDEPYTGQTSDSNGNDGGCNRHIMVFQNRQISDNSSGGSRRTNITHSKTKKKNKSKKEIISPATVLSDMSFSSGTNTGSSPPPRPYNRREITDATEVWYAKWWMCGFTDSLNINANY